MIAIERNLVTQRFRWGHININVTDLDTSIQFYQKLGFELFISGIPYLDLTAEEARKLPTNTARALNLPSDTKGRACIMQLDRHLPKLDLTELSELEQPEKPKLLQNTDLGIVRICLASNDLLTDYQHLLAQGVEFLSPPTTCTSRMAEVVVCKDPDGTLIELLQVHMERWPRVKPVST